MNLAYPTTTSLVYAASSGKHRPASHPVYGGTRAAPASPPWPMTPENIRRRRQAQGLTQYQLAELMGVTRTAVSWWESGSHPPSDEHAARLRQVLP